MGKTKMHPYTLAKVCRLWLAGGAASALWAGPALSQGDGVPAENWAKVADCAQFKRGDERLACVDEVFRMNGLFGRAGEVVQQRQRLNEHRPEAQQPAAQDNSTAPRPGRRLTASTAELEQIATTVSRAYNRGDRRMMIVTEDGRVWQQNESRDLGVPPQQGTSFTVEEGSLGSYFCRIGAERRFRCRPRD